MAIVAEPRLLRLPQRELPPDPAPPRVPVVLLRPATAPSSGHARTRVAEDSSSSFSSSPEDSSEDEEPSWQVRDSWQQSQQHHNQQEQQQSTTLGPSSPPKRSPARPSSAERSSAPRPARWEAAPFASPDWSVTVPIAHNANLTHAPVALPDDVVQAAYARFDVPGMLGRAGRCYLQVVDLGPEDMPPGPVHVAAWADDGDDDGADSASLSASAARLSSSTGRDGEQGGARAGGAASAELDRMGGRLHTMKQQMAQLEAEADAMEAELEGTSIEADAAEALHAAQVLQGGALVLRSVASRVNRTEQLQEAQLALLQRVDEALQPPLPQGGITPGAMRAAMAETAAPQPPPDAPPPPPGGARHAATQASPTADGGPSARGGRGRGTGGAGGGGARGGARGTAGRSSAAFGRGNVGGGDARGRRSTSRGRDGSRRTAVARQSGAAGSTPRASGAPASDGARRPAGAGAAETARQAPQMAPAQKLLRASADRQRDRHLGRRVAAAQELFDGLLATRPPDEQRSLAFVRTRDGTV